MLDRAWDKQSRSTWRRAKFLGCISDRSPARQKSDELQRPCDTAVTATWAYSESARLCSATFSWPSIRAIAASTRCDPSSTLKSRHGRTASPGLAGSRIRMPPEICPERMFDYGATTRSAMGAGLLGHRTMLTPAPGTPKIGRARRNARVLCAAAAHVFDAGDARRPTCEPPMPSAGTLASGRKSGKIKRCVVGASREQERLRSNAATSSSRARVSALVARTRAQAPNGTVSVDWLVADVQGPVPKKKKARLFRDGLS